MRIYNAHMARASSASKKTPTNVSVRADLVKRAKELGLNLSSLLEAAILEEVKAAEHAAWLAANEDAIRAYNARVEKHGVFGDDVRTF